MKIICTEEEELDNFIL
jgi:hypothetical protein